MKERIKDKIAEIEEFLEFLYNRIPKTLEEYKVNLEKKAICERYIEKIIEAIVDLAFLIRKYLNIPIPEEITDTEILDLLATKKIISENLAKKLQDAKGMRNIIAHEYGKIDDEIIFNALSNELENDVKEFITKIKENLEKFKRKEEK